MYEDDGISLSYTQGTWQVRALRRLFRNEKGERLQQKRDRASSPFSFLCTQETGAVLRAKFAAVDVGRISASGSLQATPSFPRPSELLLSSSTLLM